MYAQPDSFPDRVDCLILGGGITGAGVARDAAMRGLSTLVIDSDDFASGTSHVTSKLVHGGFRYLQHMRFGLVWESIVERERLMNSIAWHLCRPLRFILPFRWKRAPLWLLGTVVVHLYGFLQWLHCGRRSGVIMGERLRQWYPELNEGKLALSFWDAQAHDARLVMASLRTAQSHGAILRNYTRVTNAEFRSDEWIIQFVAENGHEAHTVRARSLVNATGPWSSITAELLGVDPAPVAWIKGSHIILKKPAEFGTDALVIRSLRDGRPMWVVPWENRLLVGSTETAYGGDLRHVHPSRDEVDDLFNSFLHVFPAFGVTRDDIVCAFAGVRPLVARNARSGNKMSRDHRVLVDGSRALVTVTGGKLTTFRRMAEDAVNAVCKLLSRPSADRAMRRRLRSEPIWPRLTRNEFTILLNDLLQRFPIASGRESVVEHLVRHYGPDASIILMDWVNDPHSSRRLDDELPYTVAELIYLCRYEKVRHLIDLVRRRTKLYFLAERFGVGLLNQIAREVATVMGWSVKQTEDEVHQALQQLEADLRALQNEVHPKREKVVA